CSERRSSAVSYNLQPDEVMLLSQTGVAHGKNLGSYAHELMLTNQNLVFTKKSLFGGGITVFPLREIKVYNGKAQAVLTKSRGGTTCMEIGFMHGQETFAFNLLSPKKRLNEWIAKINEVVTGEEAPESSSLALPGAELVAGALRDTISVFKSKLAPASVSVATKCGSCGASLTGVAGQ